MGMFTVDSPHVNEYQVVQCRQEETSRRSCMTLVGHMLFKREEMS